MQATLERALSTITGEDVHLVGSGRTDAGAHAFAQVVAFSTDCSLPTESLCRALNANLPDDIAVTHVADVPEQFHPRFDACSRTYRYLIWNRPVRSPFWLGRALHIRRPLDAGLMNRALACLIGTHDVSAFVPVHVDGSRERTIFDARCWRDEDLVVVQLQASGFMRQMVRSIVGTVVAVGSGTLSVDAFRNILLSRDRYLAGDTVPASGLYLLHVEYRDEQDHHSNLPDGHLRLAVAAPDRLEEKQ